MAGPGTDSGTGGCVFHVTQALSPVDPAFSFVSHLPLGAEKAKGVGLQLLLRQEGEEAVSPLRWARRRCRAVCRVSAVLSQSPQGQLAACSDGAGQGPCWGK